MKYRINYELTADMDFETIRDYFMDQEGSIDIAEKIIGNIIRRGNDLKSTPMMYKVCEYCPDFRQFTESGYLVLYLINEEAHVVEIHHIWHGMRNIKAFIATDRGSGT
jgi:plasmid stabilization system protein ParE